MKVINYEEMKATFNAVVHDNRASSLFSSIAKNPQRFIGKFRATSPKGKVMQNLTQSIEVKMGALFEILIEDVFISYGYEPLDKVWIAEDGKELHGDLFFIKNDELLFIEQKVRDDHDSTKKRGQFENFVQKAKIIEQKYPDKKLTSAMFFLDPSLKKNKKFYNEKCFEETYLSNLNVFYGDELFVNQGIGHAWMEDVEDFLDTWREEEEGRGGYDINLDLNPQNSFDEIKKLPLSVINKFFNNKDLMQQISPIIFPNNEVPQLLKDFLQSTDHDFTSKKDIKLCASIVDNIDQHILSIQNKSNKGKVNDDEYQSWLNLPVPSDEQLASDDANTKEDTLKALFIKDHQVRSWTPSLKTEFNIFCQQSYCDHSGRAMSELILKSQTSKDDHEANLIEKKYTRTN